MPTHMADMEGNEFDTRPLNEKLADHVQSDPPLNWILDLSSGVEVQIIGKPHDIDRIKAACKSFLKRVENDKLDIDKEYTVHVPARDTT